MCSGCVTYLLIEIPHSSLFYVLLLMCQRVKYHKRNKVFSNFLFLLSLRQICLEKHHVHKYDFWQRKTTKVCDFWFALFMTCCLVSFVSFVNVPPKTNKTSNERKNPKPLLLQYAIVLLLFGKYPYICKTFQSFSWI